ncbi:glutamine-rich protein 2-like isoform X3 [Salvelinus fontinalis]|nr:glutamine-rich protein 2-like isoform X3 [Salvelinus fontinalis]
MSRAKLRKRLTPTQPPPTPLRPPTQDGLVRPPEPPHSPLLLGDSLGGHSLVQGPQGSSLEVKDPSLLVPEHPGSILELPLSLVGSRPAQGYRHSAQLDLEPLGNTQLGLEPRGNTQLGLEPRDSTQLGLEPQGNTQLGLEPRGNTQPGLEPRGNTQPGLGPRGNTQLGLELRGNTQLGLEPRGNTQPGLEPRGNTQPGLEPRGNTQLGLELRGNTQLGLEPRGNTQPGLEPRGNTQLGLELRGNTQLGLEPRDSSLEPPCSTRLDPSKLVPEHPQDPTPMCLTQEPSLVGRCMGLEVQELPSLLQEAPSLVEPSLPSPLDHGVLEVVEASLPSPATQGPWDHTGGKRLQEAC